MDRDGLVREIEKNGIEGAKALERFLREAAPKLAELAAFTSEALRGGAKVIAFGNGGSASDAQHLAGELVGRFSVDRPPLAAISLNVDTSVITCVGNDYGFEEVFSRQVMALGRKGDVAIGISTSGRSPNVLKALAVARDMGMKTVGLTGADGGLMAQICDELFRAPTPSTPRVQECHIAWIHAFCGAVEALSFGPEGSKWP